MKKYFALGVLIINMFSCSTDKMEDGTTEIEDQILTGTVEGQAFTFMGGMAFSSTNFSDEEVYVLNLTNESVTCETDIFDYGLRISVTVLKEEGEQNDVNIVTQDGDNTPFNSLQQSIEITMISDTEISGKMSLNKSESSISPESIFEGTFTIPICDN
ncbi:hypothetical protein KO500_11155 [Cellulophaga baltica]|uniref:hypothetical protein n=1 Tax=Cellulophaga TaxID=104264 RepID=UPI001C0705CB|nr:MULTISPECIES: hypothetical protein [Cellulophaga]MBU2996996.1 hypothetical protein [Cellulophaga baltica]MDO6768394.1 hypothetical protein [Cellulophaga sp. 1_MG-2023]